MTELRFLMPTDSRRRIAVDFVYPTLERLLSDWLACSGQSPIVSRRCELVEPIIDPRPLLNQVNVELELKSTYEVA